MPYYKSLNYMLSRCSEVFKILFVYLSKNLKTFFMTNRIPFFRKTMIKTFIRYAKENDREKKRERERKVEAET